MADPICEYLRNSAKGRVVDTQTYLSDWNNGMSREHLESALVALKTGDFEVGPDMERAHAICQDHEGEWAFDWIHALVHRIEGDDGNAAYWYRRAGKSRHAGPKQEEWQIIWDEVL